MSHNTDAVLRRLGEMLGVVLVSIGVGALFGMSPERTIGLTLMCSGLALFFFFFFFFFTYTKSP